MLRMLLVDVMYDLLSSETLKSKTECFSLFCTRTKHISTMSHVVKNFISFAKFLSSVKIDAIMSLINDCRMEF
jgi:hypothetical protein